MIMSTSTPMTTASRALCSALPTAGLRSAAGAGIMAPGRMPLPGPIRSAIRALRFVLRRLSSRHWALPDFIIAGARRAGAKALFRYLAQLAKAYGGEVDRRTALLGRPPDLRRRA